MSISPLLGQHKNVNNSNFVYFEKPLIKTAWAKCLDCSRLKFGFLVPWYRLIKGRQGEPGHSSLHGRTEFGCI